MGLKLTANLTKTFKKLSDDLEKRHKDIVKETLIDTHNRIILTSPVDSGVYRANNFLEANTSTKEATTESNMNMRLAETESVKIEIKNGKKYVLYNPVAYAEKIEGGHSKQAVQGVYAPAAEFMRGLITKKQLRIKFEAVK